MDGKIFNSKSCPGGVLTEWMIYGPKGRKLYELKGANIYNLFRKTHGAFERFAWFEDMSWSFYR
ncbi:MAG: hypothetical protein JWP25_2443 [Bradyrhizobium sp.]|nr:hypothetical protein [Bradyrhizobium sp.]